MTFEQRCIKWLGGGESKVRSHLKRLQKGKIQEIPTVFHKALKKIPMKKTGRKPV
jgi:hypothetical protein